MLLIFFDLDGSNISVSFIELSAIHFSPVYISQ